MTPLEIDTKKAEFAKAEREGRVIYKSQVGPNPFNEKTHKTLGEARARFASVRISGMFPDIIKFDVGELPQYQASNEFEIAVCGEFAKYPEWGGTLGWITREIIED